MTRSSDKQNGFTLIEVSTALIFVGFIIFILAATTVNIVRSYNKGIWLAQINQAGQQMNSDIGDKARYSGVAVVQADKRRMCINGVSYLWNTQKEIDNNNPGSNVYLDGTPIRLARIEDKNGEYCTKDQQPGAPGKDPNVRALLGRGVAIQEFKVSQATGVPLLTVSMVVSTEGANRPIKAYTDHTGVVHIDADQNNPNSSWQCGEWIDKNDNKIVDSPPDTFTPAKNQYCSFAEYTFTVYERSKI
ncbi:MAG: type II secretion system protein [Candidatus Nanoperiomorbus sp.]